MNINKTQGGDFTLKKLLLKFHEHYTYLLSRWLVILAFCILGGALGFAYAWIKKPLYIAATTFVLEDGEKSGGFAQYAGLASMAGIDLGSDGGGIFQGDNILELYKSRTMIGKTLLTEIEYKGKKQLLIDRYIDFNESRNKWAKNQELVNIQFRQPEHFTRLQDSVLGRIINDINQNYLKVEKPDKKLSIIKVEVKATDEIFAKAFNEQIVKNVNDFYIQTKTKKSLENVVVLQQKTDSVRKIMNGAIFTAASVNDATPNLNPTREIQRVVPVQRSQFNIETNKTLLGELVKNLELSKVSLSKETPLIQVIDQPIYPLETIKVGKIRGAVTGAFLIGFLVTIILLFLKILKGILDEKL